MEITDVVKVVMEQIKETVRSETVVGTPVQAEDSVIIPVSRVSFGFGAGGGNKGEPENQGGMGAGGGATVEPVAFVVVSKGKAQLLPLKSREATLTRLIDLIPSILDLAKGIKTKEPDKGKTRGRAKEEDKEK
jgi:sporulation protein YtfJ